VKRRRALLESNPPRNNRLRLIETVRGRERSNNLIRSLSGFTTPPDDRSLMPQKTHSITPFIFLFSGITRIRVSSNSASGTRAKYTV